MNLDRYDCVYGELQYCIFSTALYWRSNTGYDHFRLCWSFCLSDYGYRGPHTLTVIAIFWPRAYIVRYPQKLWELRFSNTASVFAASTLSTGGLRINFILQIAFIVAVYQSNILLPNSEPMHCSTICRHALFDALVRIAQSMIVLP